MGDNQSTSFLRTSVSGSITFTARGALRCQFAELFTLLRDGPLRCSQFSRRVADLSVCILTLLLQPDGQTALTSKFSTVAGESKLEALDTTQISRLLASKFSFGVGLTDTYEPDSTISSHNCNKEYRKEPEMKRLFSGNHS